MVKNINMKQLMGVLLLWCCMGNLMAQQFNDVQKLVTDMLETMPGEQLGNANYEELINDLLLMRQQPINLNAAEKADLEKFFFLTDHQIENLLYYRHVNGPLYSIYELQAVEQMDSLTISYLLPFVVTERLDYEPRKRIEGQVLARLQSTLQTPLGYRSKNDSTPPSYLGSKEKWMTRARIRYGDKAEFGFTLEKDQGEVAFPQYFPIADFSSAFLLVNQPTKWVDTWIVGDYRLSFGQGLGLWTDMAFSKSTETAQLRRRARGIRSYSSVNEYSFLRGTALKVKLNNFSISPFISYKKRDASLADDTLDDQYLSSLQETGYHRTLSEVANRNRVHELVYGAQTEYRHHLFSIEAGYVNWKVDRPIAGHDHLKNLYRFKGDKQSTYFLSHSIFLNKLTLFGEMAVQNGSEYGVYQGLTYNAGADVITSLAFRKYANGYKAILSNPFSESSTRAGESGVFASISARPFSRLNLKAFVDVFKYSWLRYNVYRPSNGFEWFAQANYQINELQQVYLRYKSTQKEVNSSDATSFYAISTYQKNSIRGFYSAQADDKWRFQTQLEYAGYTQASHRSKGWVAFQDVRYAGEIVSASIRYVLFDIDDYESRIYNYEPDVLYAFSIPAYLNEGSRLIFNLKISLVKGLKIWGRIAHTSYSNINQIGSGNQLINGNRLTEWKVQMQYRF